MVPLFAHALWEYFQTDPLWKPPYRKSVGSSYHFQVSDVKSVNPLRNSSLSCVPWLAPASATSRLDPRESVTL